MRTKPTPMFDLGSLRTPRALLLSLLACLIHAALATTVLAQVLPETIDLAAPAGPGTPLTRFYATPPFNVGGAEKALSGGDINGDGHDDLVIGYTATVSSNGGQFAGAVVVRFATPGQRPTLANSIDANSTALVTGEPSANLGASIAVGDINGDGYDDIVAGAPGANSFTGAVIVYSGAALPPGASFMVETAGSVPLTGEARIAGNQMGANFGGTVTVADFDQDGKDDIAIGEASANLPGKDYAGRAYIIFGNTVSFGSSVNIGDVPNHWEIRGGEQFDALGAAVVAGDVTGDGFPDVVIGRPRFNGFGGGGVVVIPSPTPMDKVLDLNNVADVATTIRLIGFHSMGSALDVGEVDGDKYADILMTGSQSNLGGTSSGAAAIFSGVDAIVGQTYTISGAGDQSKILFIGSDEGGNFGTTAELADINGDGLDDAILSSPFGDSTVGETTAFNTGRIHVYTGLNQLAGTYDIDEFPPSTLIYGEAAFTYAGKSLHADADLDSDGLPDLVTTANSIVATEGAGNGVTYVLYSGESEAESASRIEALKAGAVPRRGIGGRLSPTLGAFVSFTGGTAGTLTVERSRDRTTLPPLGVGDFRDVCGSYWNLETTRAAFGMAEITLEYSEADIAGINPEGFELYRYDAQDMSWSAVAAWENDPATRRITFETNQLGLYALATTAPVITLIGAPVIHLECNLDGIYTEPGATAYNESDGNLDDFIVVGGDSVNPAIPGTYVITYNVFGGDGTPAAEVVREVVVTDSIPPSLEVIGGNKFDIECEGFFGGISAISYDQCDGVLTGQVVLTGDVVDPTIPGMYRLYYNVQDSSGNAAPQIDVTVTIADTTAPTIELEGNAVYTLDCQDEFTDPLYTASDDCYGDLTGTVTISGDILDTSVPGTYVLLYNVSDGAGLSAQTKTRVINVLDNCPEGEIDGGIEGEGETEGVAEGEGASEGEGHGGAEGEGEDVIEGEGSVEGEGETEGAAEGAAEGAPEGEGEGDVDGAIEGEGETEGVVEGSVEGVEEGGTEGTKEGEAQGNVVDELLIAFAAFDADASSWLSFAEGSAIWPTLTQNQFDALDTDGNGQLTAAELLRVATQGLVHNADLNANGLITLSEVLRAIQLYSAGNYRCAALAGHTEDGYLPEGGLLECPPHQADQNGDGNISLGELLRIIQFFAMGGLHPCPDGATEDGFCPGVL